VVGERLEGLRGGAGHGPADITGAWGTGREMRLP
jgi:hypothetical protein